MVEMLQEQSESAYGPISRAISVRLCHIRLWRTIVLIWGGLHKRLPVAK